MISRPLARFLGLLCLGLPCGSVSGGEDASIALTDDSCDSPALAGSSLLQSRKIFGEAPPTSLLNQDAVRQADTLTRNTSLFFYHVHVPRTGGSTVANLLVADICDPSRDTIPLNWYYELCTEKCKFGLTDNEFACYKDRILIEHDTFAVNEQRAEELQAKTGAEQLIFVTTLRRGSDRVLSQWSHETNVGLWRPPPGVKHNLTNESLAAYLLASTNAGGGWHARKSASQRANLQVAQLASVDNTADVKVTREHLEIAKQVLLKGKWLIGFTNCLEKVHNRLTLYGDALFGKVTRKTIPQKEASNYSSSAHVIGHGLVVSDSMHAMLDEYCSLDNELYEWAVTMAKTDRRFTEPC